MMISFFFLYKWNEEISFFTKINERKWCKKRPPLIFYFCVLWIGYQEERQIFRKFPFFYLLIFMILLKKHQNWFNPFEMYKERGIFILIQFAKEEQENWMGGIPDNKWIVNRIFMFFILSTMFWRVVYFRFMFSAC